MKRIIALALSLTLTASMIGCGNAPQSNTPPAALAPGYSSPADQSLGQSLAALVYFVNQETTKNYPSLTPAQQANEKPYLNSLIDATNIANVSYTAFHAGTQTLAQAQSAYNQAQIAETNLTSHAGVK